MEDEIEGLQTRISKYDEEIAALNATIKEQSEAADKADAMVAKYTKDQDNVRNNREYDFLTKEIEYQQLNIELAEKKINDAKHAIEVTNANMDAAKTQLEDCTHVLAEKKGELDEIISETKQDEEKLREKAKIIIKRQSVNLGGRRITKEGFYIQTLGAYIFSCFLIPSDRICGS